MLSNGSLQGNLTSPRASALFGCTVPNADIERAVCARKFRRLFSELLSSCAVDAVHPSKQSRPQKAMVLRRRRRLNAPSPSDDTSLLLERLSGTFAHPKDCVGREHHADSAVVCSSNIPLIGLLEERGVSSSVVQRNNEKRKEEGR